MRDLFAVLGFVAGVSLWALQIFSAQAAVEGTITNLWGAPVPGVKLQADNGLPFAITDAGGHYAIEFGAGSSFTVVPSLTNLAFVPAGRHYASLSSSVQGQDFLAVESIAAQLAVRLQSTNLTLSWTGIPGITFQLHVSTNLADWLPSGSALPGSNDVMAISTPAASDGGRFFRIVSSNGLCQSTNPGQTPDTPDISLDAVNSTHSSIRLDIANSHQPASYEIWKSTDGGLTYTHVDTIEGDATSFTDAGGMPSGSMWTFKLRSAGRVDFSNVVGPLVHMQHGGAVVLTAFATEPRFAYSLHSATLDNDGSAVFTDGCYGAPIAGSRGAVLNAAIQDFNTLSGTPWHSPLGHSLYISAGHFDCGGAWVSQPRYWWASSAGNLGGMGIYGQGIDATCIQLSSPTLSWGPSFNAVLYGNNTVLRDFSINQYYDGPDQLFAPGSPGNVLWLKNVRADGTRCRDGGGTVVKGGICAEGIPTGCATTVLDGGNQQTAFAARIIDCEMYASGHFIVGLWGTPGDVNSYGTSFYRKLAGPVEDFLVQDGPGTGVINALNFYNCVIDGGNIASFGAVSYSDNSRIGLYAGTVFQHRLAGVNNFDLTDMSDSAQSIRVSSSAVYGATMYPPVTVPEPGYTVPELPVPPLPAFKAPVFVR